METEKAYNYSEYLKKFPSNYRAREYWKLFKIRGRKDNRYLQFNLCQECIPKLYANKARMMCNVNKEDKLQNININMQLCESCIARNLFEVCSYEYKCGLKRPFTATNYEEKFCSEDDIRVGEKKQKQGVEYVKEPNITEEIMDKKKQRKTRTKKIVNTDIVVLDS